MHGGRCGVCKTALFHDARVACPDCRSLYHEDCWRYNDRRCAVYGCARAERDPLPSLGERGSFVLRAIPPPGGVPIYRRKLSAEEVIVVAVAFAIAIASNLL